MLQKAACFGGDAPIGRVGNHAPGINPPANGIHHGGGVGIGNSLHAGQVLVADGTPEMDVRIERVLTNDPGIGVARHVDAGYEMAIETARAHGLDIPMLD